MTAVPADEYALVNADRLRERRKSSPDSDPRELKAQILDHRFEAVNARISDVSSELREHKSDTGEKLDALSEKLAETTLEVAKGTATLKAYLAAVALILTVINVGAAVLSKFVSATPVAPPTVSQPR